jgi:hypothetical protein
VSTLEEVMQLSLAERQAYIQHEAGLNHDGEQVCMRCGISMPRLLPIFRPVAQKGTVLYVGEAPLWGFVPDATPCQKKKYQWNAQP